mmetsp:Transcript_27411/g.40608  ORF Transcript_27411/g.40608 Transcript_27411/m.40608 type:complete len:87 (-) Transcript_27411:157-417(-)
MDQDWDLDIAAGTVHLYFANNSGSFLDCIESLGTHGALSSKDDGYGGTRNDNGAIFLDVKVCIFAHMFELASYPSEHYDNGFDAGL